MVNFFGRREGRKHDKMDGRKAFLVQKMKGGEGCKENGVKEVGEGGKNSEMEGELFRLKRWREPNAKREGRKAFLVQKTEGGEGCKHNGEGREGREGKVVRWRRRELFRLKRWRELWREEEDFHL